MEGRSQVEGCLVQGQPAKGCPQFQHIAVDGALRLETLEDLFAQMHRKSWLALPGLAMHGATAAPLQTTTAELLEKAQVAQHLFHGHLLTQEGEINLGPVGGRRIDRGP